MAQTQVGRKATLIKNVVIGPHLCTRIAAITRNETYEVKLNISIILRARTEFLRTTVVCLAGSPRESHAADVQGWHSVFWRAARVPEGLRPYGVARTKVESSQGCRDFRPEPQYLATTPPELSARHQVLTRNPSSAARGRAPSAPGQETACEV